MTISVYLTSYEIIIRGMPVDKPRSFVIRLHSGNGEHKEIAERAETCFRLALAECNRCVVFVGQGPFKSDCR